MKLYNFKIWLLLLGPFSCSAEHALVPKTQLRGIFSLDSIVLHQWLYGQVQESWDFIGWNGTLHPIRLLLFMLKWGGGAGLFRRVSGACIWKQIVNVACACMMNLMYNRMLCLLLWNDSKEWVEQMICQRMSVFTCLCLQYSPNLKRISPTPRPVIPHSPALPSPPQAPSKRLQRVSSVWPYVSVYVFSPGDLWKGCLFYAHDVQPSQPISFALWHQTNQLWSCDLMCCCC